MRMSAVAGELGADGFGWATPEITAATAFERQVASAPENLAIVSGETSLTYGALNRKADAIAAALAALPSPLDRPIVLLIGSEIALAAAMLGALKAGRIFIPLALNAPAAWVSQVIADSGASHILADSATHDFAKRVAENGVGVLNADDVSAATEPFVSKHLLSATDPAYVVYTSGSTGRPKGVVCNHRPVVRTSIGRAAILGMKPGDRYANARSSGVSSGIHNTLLPLTTGGCLLPFDLHKNGLQKFAAWLIAQKISYVSFSGSLFRTWTSSLDPNVRFPDLRILSATGEPVYAQDVAAAIPHLVGDWCISHSYASTETGIIAVNPIRASRLPEAGIVPPGWPVAGHEISIEDEGGSPVPFGNAGEIVIRSRSLALGYWKNPELTEKVFTPDPRGDGLRIYRTGDLGRLRPDGMLQHLGRIGRRVKVRGYSVEPFEVECALRRIEGVRDAAVILRKDGEEEAHLVGYVVASDSSPAGLRGELAKDLPSHMVPSDIILLDNLPMNASGKIDRAALPIPERKSDSVVEQRAPTNDGERIVAAILADVLGRSSIGIDDDFYDLGGTSLQAFLTFARISTRLGRDLPPTMMMEAPTAAKLAALFRTSTPAIPPALISFREGGALTPLFVVHARLGNIMFVKNIVRDLKSDRPVYGIQPPPLDGKHRIPKTIEEIAAGYLADIRKVQAKGPYFLAGYSWGGRLAFEIAQQLNAQGERVAFLGLIDTMFDFTREVAGETKEARVQRHMQALKSQAIGPYLIRRIRKTAAHYAANTSLMARFLPNYVRMRLRLPIPYTRRLDVYSYVYSSATRRYTLHPYSGPVTMFAAKGREEYQRARWSRVAKGELTVHEITGAHFEMVEPPHSTFLAAKFDESLARVDAQAKPQA